MSSWLVQVCRTQRCKREYTGKFIAALKVQQQRAPSQRLNMLDETGSAFDAGRLLFDEIQTYMASEGLRDLMEYRIAVTVHTQHQLLIVLRYIASFVYLDGSTTALYDVSNAEVPALVYTFMVTPGARAPTVIGLYTLLRPVVESYLPFPHPRGDWWYSSFNLQSDLTGEQLSSLAYEGVGSKKSVSVLVSTDAALAMKNKLRDFGFTIRYDQIRDSVKCKMGNSLVSIDDLDQMSWVRFTFTGQSSASDLVRERREAVRRELRERARARAERDGDKQQLQHRSSSSSTPDSRVSWYEEKVYDPISMEQVKVKDAVREDPSLLLFIIDNKVPALVSPKSIADVEDPLQASLMENTRCMRGQTLFSMNRYGLSGDMTGEAATGIRGYMKKLSEVLQPGVNVYRADRTGICELAEYAGQPVYSATAVISAVGEDTKMQVTLRDASPWQ